MGMPMIWSCQYRRLAMCALLLLLAFGGLGYRLVDLHVLRHEELLAEAEKMWQLRVEQPTQRGRIVDARGQLLATSLPVKTVEANPEWVGTNQALVARTLAPWLGMSEAELEHRMRRRTVVWQGRERPAQRVVLKRRVPIDIWESIREEMRKLPREAVADSESYQELTKSVFPDSVDREMRFYPNGRLAAHVLGFTGYRQEAGTGDSADELVGKSGIEAAFNPVLAGIPGWRQILKDERGRELRALRPIDVASRDGLGVRLTIDLGLQHIVESELDTAFAQHRPLGITAIMVRPRTGEILAMANLPTFDPNRPGDEPAGQLRNRAITDLMEPGSTFKALVVAAALNEGLIRLEDKIECEGQWYYRGFRVRDMRSYGPITVEEILARSSNIGAAKIGVQLGEERLHQYAQRFGIGDPTRILLGGEVSGLLHPLGSWSRISVASIPIGYEVAVTPLQMTMALSAIANGGVLMRPMLVSELLDQQGQVVARFDPTPVRQVVGEPAAGLMARALQTAVAEGTGRRAQLEYYQVAGKTGTARKLVKGDYDPFRHVGSFIGFFPAHDPQLCISVVVDAPKAVIQGARAAVYGGETAAPVFQRIAERAAVYLAIPPTRSPESSWLTSERAAGQGVSRARAGGANL
jgi:cell division protein FtsI/penicillin-binding protein 2